MNISVRYAIQPLLLLLGLSGLDILTAHAGTILKQPIDAPDFTHHAAHEWINSDPLTLKDIEGRVVLIDVWTFDCWNCNRLFPWLKAMESRLADEAFQVISVHSPEFEHEGETHEGDAQAKRIETIIRELLREDTADSTAG